MLNDDEMDVLKAKLHVTGRQAGHEFDVKDIHGDIDVDLRWAYIMAPAYRAITHELAAISHVPSAMALSDREMAVLFNAFLQGWNTGSAE